MTKSSKLLIIGKCKKKYTLFFYNIISKLIESRISQHSDFLDTYLYQKFNCVFLQEKRNVVLLWTTNKKLLTFTKEIMGAIKSDNSNQFISIYKKKILSLEN